jgi:deoxyribodipyrimidine photolyase-related protein
MPEYGTLNALGAERPLPELYWNGKTDMACIAQVVRQTRRDAYAHHIQRLMVTGNFALLAGLHPDAVDEWYLSVYADAYQWVEMPNTRGMALFADGGMLGSKPYAASGAYINRMSDYCRGCAYDVKQATAENACPFNFLYWDFIARHAARFASNPRMAMPLRNWDRMPADRRAAIRARAAAFLAGMEAGDPAAAAPCSRA